MSTNVLITHVEPAWILTTTPFCLLFFALIQLHLASLSLLFFTLLPRSHPSCLRMWICALACVRSATSARDNRGHVSVSLFSPPSHVSLCQISGHPQRNGQPRLWRWRHGSEVRQAHQTHWCRSRGLSCMTSILYRGTKTHCQTVFEHLGQLNQ